MSRSQRPSDRLFAETKTPDELPLAPIPFVPLEPLRVPGRFGPFELIEHLGRGSQAAVLRARWCEGEREGELCALKILETGRELTAGARQRFEREAALARERGLSGVAQVQGSGTCEGRTWFAMDLVPGSSLAQRLDATRRQRARASNALPHEVSLPPLPGETHQPHLSAELHRVVGYFARFARVFGELHAAGVIHRDVKPSNLMIEEAGQVRVLDLGVARTSDEDDSEGLTRTGSVLGSPAYMAPEQVRGEAERIGPATDIWGLGVSLYEALTLERPFDGLHREELFRNILVGEPPSPADFHPKLPLGLRAILGKALRKNPARRYASMLEFAEDLERLQRGELTLARLAGPIERLGSWARRRPRLATGIAVSLGLVLLTLAGTILMLFAEQHLRRDVQILSAAAAINSAVSAVEIGDADRSRHLLEEARARLAGSGMPERLLEGFETRLIERELDPRLSAAPLRAEEIALVGLRDAEAFALLESGEVARADFRESPVRVERSQVFAPGQLPQLAAFDAAGERIASLHPSSRGFLRLQVHRTRGDLVAAFDTPFREAKLYALRLAFGPQGRWLVAAGALARPDGRWSGGYLLMDLERNRSWPWRELGEPDSETLLCVGAVVDGHGLPALALQRRLQPGPLRLFVARSHDEVDQLSPAALPTGLDAIGYSPDGSQLTVLFSRGTGQTGHRQLQRWGRAADGGMKLLDRLDLGTMKLRSASFLEGSGDFALWHRDHSLEFLEARGEPIGLGLRPGSLGEHAPAFGATGRYFVVPRADALVLYDRQRLRAARILSRSGGSVSCLSFDAAGDRLLIGRRHAPFELLAIDDGHVIESRIQFGPGLGALAEGGRSFRWFEGPKNAFRGLRSLREWGQDAEEPVRELGELPGEAGDRHLAAIGPRFSVVQTTRRRDPELVARELRDSRGRLVRHWGTSEIFSRLAIAADVPVAVGLNSSGVLHVLDGISGRQRRYEAFAGRLGGDTPRVLSISRDGRLVGIGADAKGRTFVLDLVTREQWQLEAGSSHQVRAMCFLPGEFRRLASLQLDGSLLIWLLEGERGIELMHTHLGIDGVSAAAFDRTGQRLAVGSDFGPVVLVDLRPEPVIDLHPAPALEHRKELVSVLQGLVARPAISVCALRALLRNLESRRASHRGTLRWREAQLMVELRSLFERPERDAAAEMCSSLERLRAGAANGLTARTTSPLALCLHLSGRTDEARALLAARKRPLSFYAWMDTIVQKPEGLAAFRLLQRALERSPLETGDAFDEALAALDPEPETARLARVIFQGELDMARRFERLVALVEVLIVDPDAVDTCGRELLRLARTLEHLRPNEKRFRDLHSLALLRTGRLAEAREHLRRRLHSTTEKRIHSPPLAAVARGLLFLELGEHDQLARWCDQVIEPVLRLPSRQGDELAATLYAELKARMGRAKAKGR